MSHIDLTRVGPNTGARDYAIRNNDMQAKDRSGVLGFLGKLFSPITRTEQDKEANRAAVREYIGQVAEKFGLPEAMRIADQLTGHLARGNPLSSHRVAVLNATLAPNRQLGAEDRIAGSLSRLLDGVGSGSDFGRILATPFKRPALEALKTELRQFADSIKDQGRSEQLTAMNDLVDRVAQKLVDSGLDEDKVAIRSRIVEPLIDALGLFDHAKTESAKLGGGHRSVSLDGPLRVERPVVGGPTRDLTTPQTERSREVSKSALTTAFECSSAMVIAEATKTESTLGRLVPGLDAQVSGFFSGIQDFSNGSTDLGTLKSVKELLEKSFVPGGGGIGRFPRTDDWNPNWAGSKFDPAKPLTDPLNQRALADLKAMATWFAGHAGDYMGRASIHEKDLRAIQFSATIGQVFNDILMENKLDQAARTSLKTTLIARGAIRDNEPVWSAFRTNVRGSPLLMELDNAKAATKLLEKYGPEIDAFLPDDLSVGDRAQLKELLLDALTRVLDTRDHTSGARGRYPGIDPRIAKLFSNRDQPLRNCMDLPDPSLDGPALREVSGLVDPGSQGVVNQLVTSIETTDLLGHGARPITVQRQYTLPSTLREMIVDPRRTLLAAFDHISGPQPQSVLQSLDRVRQNVRGAPDGAFDALKGQLRNVQITDKQGRTHSAGAIADEPSVMNLIHKHNQRTLCGISGTTTDICLSFTSQMDIVTLKATLLPAIEYARTGDPSVLTDDFRDLFTSISMFMQGGQYHTPAEVLGGLLMAAATIFDDPAIIDRNDMTAMKNAYDRLLAGLSSAPEVFFAMGMEDQESFRRNVGEGAGTVRDLQVRAIQARLDVQGQTSGGRYFEA